MVFKTLKLDFYAQAPDTPLAEMCVLALSHQKLCSKIFLHFVRRIELTASQPLGCTAPMAHGQLLCNRPFENPGYRSNNILKSMNKYGVCTETL